MIRPIPTERVHVAEALRHERVLDLAVVEYAETGDYEALHRARVAVVDLGEALRREDERRKLNPQRRVTDAP